MMPEWAILPMVAIAAFVGGFMLGCAYMLAKDGLCWPRCLPKLRKPKHRTVRGKNARILKGPMIWPHDYEGSGRAISAAMDEQNAQHK